MSLSQTDIQLKQINEPCSGRSVHSYTSPNYVCLRCHRTSSPNYPLGLWIGLLCTNLRASTVLQRAGAVLWTAGAAGAVFSHTVVIYYGQVRVGRGPVAPANRLQLALTLQVCKHLRTKIRNILTKY